MLPNGETCATCCLWDEFETQINRDRRRLGKCRRNAPVVISRPDGRLSTIYPLVSEDDWCAEHATHS